MILTHVTLMAHVIFSRSFLKNVTFAFLLSLCLHRNSVACRLVLFCSLFLRTADDAAKLTASARWGLLKMADDHFLWCQFKHRLLSLYFELYGSVPWSAGWLGVKYQESVVYTHQERSGVSEVTIRVVTTKTHKKGEQLNWTKQRSRNGNATHLLTCIHKAARFSPKNIHVVTL